VLGNLGMFGTLGRLGIHRILERLGVLGRLIIRGRLGIVGIFERLEILGRLGRVWVSVSVSNELCA
jgi:hypothetical protein